MHPASSELLLTVAICTFNRAESLRMTLNTLINTTSGIGCVWECLVVDNNSSDHTASVVQMASNALPLRYIFEPSQGLSFARNRVITEAHAPFIIFTDDDVDIQSGWLEAYIDAIQRYPDVAFMGGPILPAWQTSPPEWVIRFAPTWLNGIVVWCDCGMEEHEFTSQHDYLYGANFGFQLEALRNINGFSGKLGRSGQSLIGGEDIEAVDKLVQQGGKGIYLPKALVRHRIESLRWNRQFILKNSIGHGKTCFIRSPKFPQKWFGTYPLRLSLQIFFHAWLYAIGSLLCIPDLWLPHLCQLGWAIGEWQEVRNSRQRCGKHRKEWV